MNTLSRLFFRAIIFCLLLTGIAESRTVEIAITSIKSTRTAHTRTMLNGSAITIPAVITGPEEPKFLLIQMPPGNGAELVMTQKGKVTIGYKELPWTRIHDSLADAGITLMTVGAPSDRTKGIDDEWRRDPRHLEDMKAVLAYARLKYLQAHIFVVGSGNALASMLTVARTKPIETEGYIVIGGAWYLNQNEIYKEDKPFLVLHSVNDQCPISGFIYDAKKAVENNILTLVEAGYPNMETLGMACG